MGTPETLREPCPDRIFDDIGGAFGMGSIGGGAFHFLKGIYSSPRGERFIGGTQAVRMNAPRIGGSFAVWGGLFSLADCSLVFLRQKEDPWNSIMAGAATGGFLQVRKGFRPAMRSALFGGVLLAMIGASGIMINKLVSAQQNMPIMIDDSMPDVSAGRFQMPNTERFESSSSSNSNSNSSSSSSWFGGLFGGKKEESQPKSGVTVPESFDAPLPPTFEFK